jgi:hypothetical protein
MSRLKPGPTPEATATAKAKTTEPTSYIPTLRDETAKDGAPDGSGADGGEQATAKAKTTARATARAKAGPSTQAAKAPPSLRMTLFISQDDISYLFQDDVSYWRCDEKHGHPFCHQMAEGAAIQQQRTGFRGFGMVVEETRARLGVL